MNLLLLLLGARFLCHRKVNLRRLARTIKKEGRFLIKLFTELGQVTYKSVNSTYNFVSDFKKNLDKNQDKQEVVDEIVDKKIIDFEKQLKLRKAK